MQFRRMSALLVSALVGLTGVLSLVSVASADNVMRNIPRERELRQKISMARASKLQTAAPADPESVWIGHVSTGGYGPYKIGRGPHRIVGGKNGPASSFDGVWDFDHWQVGETDSMQGWWAIQGCMASVGPSNLHDYQRSFFGLDYGNQANYYPRQGRTFGVTGIWHADNGTVKTDSIPGSNVQVPGWAPITGTKSMWCGIRSPGDLTARDATGTGNPLNGDLTQFQANNSGRQVGPRRPQGTDHNFPGYGSQWDQILYRDINFTNNATGPVTVSFKYTCRLSNLADGVHSSQTGYFYFDPLKQTSNTAGADGNFISLAVAGPANAPTDSFMVYVGAPVEPVAGADFVSSDGVGREIFDVQRRWFSEVIKTTNLAGAPGSNATWDQLLSATGTVGSTAAPVTFSTNLTQSAVNAILDADGGAGNGGRLRLVFRVKTNRGFDDENTGNGGFTSGGAGAAIIDDVSVSGGGATTLTEGFEGTNGGVDNGTGVAATAAWKSTGKPPAAWFHLHNVETGGLPYLDPCGEIGAAVRFCNMGGNVLAPGLHDLGDKTGGVYGSNFENQQKEIVSPTINLKASGVGAYNGMGIDTEIASRAIQVHHDQLVNVYDLFITGNTWRYRWQAYPATQPNGAKGWGEATMPIFNYSSSVPGGCFNGLGNQAGVDSPILTSNAGGQPDSIRVYIQSQSRCYTQPLTSSTCSPATGPRAGGYFDNLSIGLITAPPPPALSFALWDVFNDAFPVNSTNKSESPYGAQFDTLAANVMTGYNNADNTGVLSGPGARESLPGDSAFVGANGDNVRVDLVFRIFPGVGNYVTLGDKNSAVARRPDVNPRVAASAADAGNGALTPVDKFWGAYMADNGAFGTGGNGATGPGHGGTWNRNLWNSARMDTVEVNFFPITGILGTGSTDQLTPGSYMSMIHESDPKYTILGIVKGRCFLQNPAQKIDENNINCGSLGGGGTPYPPAYITSNPAVTGYNSGEVAGQPGKTREFTKILPDGQFTPGAHVQYFFRKSTIGDPVTTFAMNPDTNFAFNDNADPHRWLEYSVLPDRWKHTLYGGAGMACMLVLDAADGRGDELMWVSMADSIGLTDPSKRGAHNGWRARPDQSILGEIGNDDTIARRDNGGQAGSMYDLFETIAGESNVSAGHPGSRGAAKNNQGSSLTIGKWSTMGPSGAMARNYRQMYWLASDIGNAGFLGPFVDQTDADVALLTDFVTLPGGSAQPRALYMSGYQLGEGMAHPDNGQQTFMTNVLRATLRSPDFRALSGVGLDVVDLLVQPAAGGTQVPQTYGVGNQCFINNDVFFAEAASPAGQAGSLYENVGSGGPYIAGVLAPTSGIIRNYVTLLNGFTIGLFGGGFGTENDLLNVGIRKYFFDHMTVAFGGMSCQPTGSPVGVGDYPGGGDGSAYVNFAKFKSSNPHRSGEVRFAFGLAKTDKVEVRVFDVTGRMVKMVANRSFAGGQEHVVTWDGTDEVGNKVKAGVYFYQLKTNGWTSQKKLAVLTN